MFKKFLFVLISFLLISSHLYAQWVSLDHSKATNTPPVVKILKDDNSSTIIQVDIAGFYLDEHIVKGQTFQSADLLTEVLSTKPGYPELPYITKILAIPDQSGISVEVIETGEIQIIDDVHLQPARESWFEGKEESPFELDTEVYNSTDVFPKEYVQIDPPVVFRDFRIARISIFPIRYSPAKNELQAISSITLEIKYGGGEVVNPKTSSKKEIAPSFGKIYKSFIFNYKSVLDNLYGGDEFGHDVMLCIMPDEFAESFQPYADWKRQSGIDVRITKFSDIGANANNPIIIKDHISDAYYNWEFPPTYVLIVGDNGIFPKKIVNYDYSFPSEDYFVEIDGNDFFPEMMIGRLTNQGDYRMRVMLNKFMKYEKEPYVADTDWFKKGICCSNNYYESQIYTKRFTANVMMEDGGFISVDTLMSDGSGGNCSMDINDVINAINEGRSYLNYRGEGWNNGWWANCYPFSVSDVSSLNNSEKLTFVTNIGCGVAMFDASGGNCFGEEWVQLGSLSAPRGAVAFVGPTSNTHTTYNNRIDKGIYVGMFQEGMETPGEALLRGKLYMYNYFGDDPWVEYHYRVFTVLGDPSTHIWKDVPKTVNLDHPTSVPIGYNQLDLAVTFTETELPVANAQICIIGESLFTTGYTDSLGHVLIEITPDMPEILTITVRGGNVIPTQGTIEVVQLDELVGFDADPIIIDLDGNTDGLINPNENCEITFSLRNWGIETAQNVQAILSTTDTDFVEIITDEPVDFGDLAPNGSSTGNPFLIFVKPDCPVGQKITMELNISSDNNTWSYEYSIEVTGCMLNHSYSLVNDIGSLNNNYRMDPGETVNLYISVDNIGYDVAPNVMGILRSNDPYITIIDSIGFFGTIDTNMSKMNTDNYFIVSVDESCPIEYLAEYSVVLYTQDGNYPYVTISDFIVPVGLPMPIDYTGPDEYGYYAYSSSDTLFDQAPDYDWFEIKGIGNYINIPGNNSEYTIAVNIPFDFQYYGIDYDAIRISTDGWVAFGDGSQTAPVNTVLPNDDNINCMVAAFWDDLYDEYNEEGDLYYYNDEANHRFIIEWDGIAINNYNFEPKREFFQVILLNPVYYPTATGDGEIIIQYKSIEGAESNTVGIENHLEDIGLQYVFNDDYDPTALSLRSEFAIKFTTEIPLFLVSVDENLDLVNESFTLDQNYPNPFISSTRIYYSLHNWGNVSLQIFNIRGELIRTLQNGKQDTGNYSLIWNGLNENGNRVSSGIYFYRLQTGKFVKTIRMLKLE